MMRVIDGIAYIRLNRPEKLNAFTNSGLVEYDTRFQVTETAYGVPTAGFWAHIAGATGAAFASDVVLTGRFFTAEEAFRAGLITAVVPAGQHLEAATALARQILAHPQEALRETVRYRRAVLAERLQHATIVAGNFKWDMTDGFKDAIRAKASR
jgi:enoyl-CoA hydratase/carnithine racemase